MSTLLELTTSTQTLVKNFLDVLATSPTADFSSVANLPPNSPNPLSVLRDAAVLLKAHTTKLSLLVINKPFTPSAIAGILKEINATCLPAIMSAVELCRPDAWTSVMNAEVRVRVRRVFKELEEIVKEVRAVAEGEIGGTQQNGIAKGQLATSTRSARDSLASTGVVWEACDALGELQRMGIVGLVVMKAEQYRDTLKDAIEELKEWGEGEDDAESQEDGSSDGVGSGEDADITEEIFGAANRLSNGHSELRKQLEESLKKLKLIGTLHQALIKRRLKTFPHNSPLSAGGAQASVPLKHLRTLDELMVILKAIPETTDDLASAFYDLDGKAARDLLQRSQRDALKSANMMKSGWDGENDEFTAWSEKWIEAINLERAA